MRPWKGFPFLLALLVPCLLLGRDINIDAIYISGGSPLFSRIIEKKIEAYQQAGSLFADRDVAFARWRNGFEVVYIKEYPATNALCVYNVNTRTRRELYRFQGTLTVAALAPTGAALVVKTIEVAPNGYPRGAGFVFSLITGKSFPLETAGAFLDFSFMPGSGSVLYETGGGIVEYFPESNIKRPFLDRSALPGDRPAGASTVVLLSPNRQKRCIVSGSGGSYRATLAGAGEQANLAGVSSISEIFWIDNNRLVYRAGGTGFYSAVLFDARTGRELTLLGPSLNTNLLHSPEAGIVSLLRDQVIHLYAVKDASMVNTCLEGEDVHVSPDGARFVSLLYKKLFITRTQTMLRRKGAIAAPVGELLALYRELLARDRDLLNSFSRPYVQRKVGVYQEMAQDRTGVRGSLPGSTGDRTCF